jgi:hypothetical protein
VQARAPAKSPLFSAAPGGGPRNLAAAPGATRRVAEGGRPAAPGPRQTAATEAAPAAAPNGPRAEQTGTPAEPAAAGAGEEIDPQPIDSSVPVPAARPQDVGLAIGKGGNEAATGRDSQPAAEKGDLLPINAAPPSPPRPDRIDRAKMRAILDHLLSLTEEGEPITIEKIGVENPAGEGV